MDQKPQGKLFLVFRKYLDELVNRQINKVLEILQRAKYHWRQRTDYGVKSSLAGEETRQIPEHYGLSSSSENCYNRIRAKWSTFAINV